MQQLNSWDAAFLYGETKFAPMHICSVAHFAPGKDGQQLSLDDVRSAVKQRLHLLPPLHQRVVYVPFGLDRPYWVDDPEVNIDEHLHQVTLLPPGDRRQLAEQVSQIAARPLDLSRPLWEMVLIHGVEGDQTVLVTKFHHAAVDGASGADFITILFDPAPETQPEPAPAPRRPDPVPRPWEMALRGLAGVANYPIEALRFQRKMMASLPQLVRPAAESIGRRGGRVAMPAILAPRTPLNGRLTPDRSWAFGEVPLDQLKAIKNALGGTVNDVVMSVCAGALRHWLLDHDALPSAPLVVMIPISLRSAEDYGSFGNHVSMMTTQLLTTIADPVQRLRATAAAAFCDRGGLPGRRLAARHAHDDRAGVPVGRRDAVHQRGSSLGEPVHLERARALRPALPGREADAHVLPGRLPAERHRAEHGGAQLPRQR
jgi:WS/DGAT/MGAT family acyltransferase